MLSIEHCREKQEKNGNEITNGQTGKDELRVITVDELRQFEGLGHLSDEQALNVIATLKELSLVTYKIVSNYEQPKSVSELRKAK
jgi:hypothetical protein